MDPDHLSLPPEIISYIICFLDPLDVVRLRLVSKQFRDISYDPAIWKALYSNARLPLPPGPFPFQSTHFLERTLIRSARLVETWTTRPVREISSLTIPIEGSVTRPPKVLYGRWLLTQIHRVSESESYTRIVVHDIESHTQQVLIEQEPGIHSWDAASITSVDGCTVYIVFCVGGVHHHSKADVKLVAFRVNMDTGEFHCCVRLDVPTTSNSMVTIDANEGPFVILLSHDLFFDTRVQMFYAIPEFKTELNVEKHPDSPIRREVIPTATHVLLFTFFSHSRNMGLMVLAQAFVSPLPLDHHAGGGGGGGGGGGLPLQVVRLNYECLLPTPHAFARLVRNSVIDPMTGSTNIRLIQAHGRPRGSYHTSLDLTLPKPNGDAVLPMKIEIRPLENLSGRPGNIRCHSSRDGYVRGIHWHNDFRGGISLMKFMVNASQDGCPVVDTSEFLRVEFTHPDTFCWGSWQYFDSLRGRIFSGVQADRATDGESKVVVVDFE